MSQLSSLSLWKSLLLALLFMTGLASTVPAMAAEKCPVLPEEIDSAIKSFNDSVRGAEYCAFRKPAFGNLDGDGREDVVVQLTIEGACHEDVGSTPGGCGNNYEFFLAAFLTKNHEVILPTKIGGKAVRHIKALSISQNNVFLNTLEYAHGDGMCCPSMKRHVAYQLQQGRLVEI